MLYFPEIESFFEKEMFTYDDLTNLKWHIESIYGNDIRILKNAYSVIDLYILKFELKHSNNVNEISSPRKIVSKQKSKRKFDTSSMSLSEKLDFYKEQTIYFILNEITDISDKEKFIRILKLKGFYKGRLNLILEEKQYLEIFDVLKAIIANNKGRDTSKRVKTNKNIMRNRSLSKSENVFDKAKKMGGLGKLIFIRSK